MDIVTSKNLGGVGSLLLFIGVVPLIAPYGLVLSLAGLILVLIGFKGFASCFKEAGIFNNALYAAVVCIVGVVVTTLVFSMGMLWFLKSLGINIPDLAGFAPLSPSDPATFDIQAMMLFFAYSLVALAVASAFLIVTAILLRKSLGLVSSKTGVRLFKTTGLLLLIGAVLTIFMVGVILVWVSILLLAIAFFSVETQQTISATT